MLLVDNTQRKPAKGRRRSARKHEARARNAIVKHDSGYAAQVDHDLNEVDALRLRVNALELEVSRLKREDAVDSGYAAPLVEPKGNVVPMSVARQAKAEKASAVHASHPLPVAGNEAHVLPSPSEPEAPKSNPTLVPHPSQVAAVSSSKAANDEDVHPPEVGERLTEISDLDSETVAQLADAYGMDVVEASEILYKEYSRREKQCYKDHGLPRDDVQLARLSRQQGQAVVGDINLGVLDYIPPRLCEGNFASWWNETEARMKNLRANSAAREAAEYRSPTQHAPWVKGEAKYRRREFVKARVDARTPNRAGFGRVQDISSKLYVGGKVTSASQVKAFGTMLFAGYQKARKLLGMQPTVRGANDRTRYEVEASHSADLPTATHARRARTAPIDTIEGNPKDVPMRELIRGYQRAGIV